MILVSFLIFKPLLETPFSLIAPQSISSAALQFQLHIRSLYFLNYLPSFRSKDIFKYCILRVFKSSYFFCCNKHPASLHSRETCIICSFWGILFQCTVSPTDFKQNWKNFQSDLRGRKEHASRFRIYFSKNPRLKDIEFTS